jgi:hypothetical protein
MPSLSGSPRRLSSAREGDARFGAVKEDDHDGEVDVRVHEQHLRARRVRELRALVHEALPGVRRDDEARGGVSVRGAAEARRLVDLAARAVRAIGRRRKLATARAVLHVGRRRGDGATYRAWFSDPARLERLAAPVASFAWSLDASAEVVRLPGVPAHFVISQLTQEEVAEFRRRFRPSRDEVRDDS